MRTNRESGFAVVIAAALIAAAAGMSSCGDKQKMQTGPVEFPAADGVRVAGDLYACGTGGAPLILLFHMANSSRGEYAAIAPRLNALGFDCLAIDQRSGYARGGVENRTAADAKKKGKGRSYADAYADLEAALSYVRRNFEPPAVLAWGSSYSADLVLVLAAERPTEIAGVLSFSPGGYSDYRGKQLADFASRVAAPAFVASARGEAAASEPFFRAVPVPEKVFFIPVSGDGEHGSPALEAACPQNGEYWTAVERFLSRWKR